MSEIITLPTQAGTMQFNASLGYSIEHVDEDVCHICNGTKSAHVLLDYHVAKTLIEVSRHYGSCSKCGSSEVYLPLSDQLPYGGCSGCISPTFTFQTKLLPEWLDIRLFVLAAIAEENVMLDWYEKKFKYLETAKGKNDE